MKKTILFVFALVLFVGACSSPKYCPTYSQENVEAVDQIDEQV
jgi:uncharacterized protein YcfL